MYAPILDYATRSYKWHSKYPLLLKEQNKKGMFFYILLYEIIISR